MRDTSNTLLGLRDAAVLGEALGASHHADRCRHEADRILEAMLHHPTQALVADGHFIKRRAVDGERVRVIQFPAGFVGGTVAFEFGKP